MYSPFLTLLSTLLLDIPLLEPPKKEDEDAGILAGIGDGFGAFRPSTSFNDLTTLLPPTDNSAPATKALAAASQEKKGSKKRSGSSSNSPASKRKATGSRRVSVSKKDAVSTAAAAAAAAAKTTPAPKPAAKPTKKAGNTPDPLTGPSTKPAVAPAAKPVVATATAKTADSSDFKSIAQAAVSSLIMSVGNNSEASANKEKVDVSTAHIKALTGSNWVAACASATQGVVPVAPPAADKNRARRQNLTPDERARQNRDRNREHARNTRLRKKAYVEELKRTLTELVSQRDAAEVEKRQAAQRELEQREVRFRVIEEFLKLRGRNETNFARWAAILEDGFSLTVPPSDLRNMSQVDSEQTLNGVSDVMADSNVFSGFLQTLGSAEGSVTCAFACDRKNFFMDNCQAVLEWSATTVGAVNKGAAAELTMKGIIRGNFSPASNKLISAKITCDTGSVLLQLQKLPGESENDVAQAAAFKADAILDSLQVPCIPSQVPTAVLVDPSSSSSEASSDKGELDSSDESIADQGDVTKNGSLSNGAPSLTA